MSRPTSPPEFLEFFSGVGLVREALMPTWRCLWANDISPKKCSVYEMNFGNAELKCGDVATVKASSLPTAEMAWASFPCQDLSLAGWRRGMSASRSGAFWPFWRVLHALAQDGRQPPVIVIENVLGLLYGDNFPGVCEAFAALDMKFGAMIVNARWFVPQSRPRVFLVAVNRNVSLGSVGIASARVPDRPWVTESLVNAVNRLPKELQKYWVWWTPEPPSNDIVDISDLIEKHPQRANWRSDQEVGELLAMMDPVNLAKIELRIGRRSRSTGFLYRRMRGGRQRAEVRFDGLAGCLRTPAGGSSRQTVVIVGGGRVRMRLLTITETKRLMGAPDHFKVSDNYNDAYRAMGDAVVVPAVRWLSDSLMLPLILQARNDREELGLDENEDTRRFRNRSKSRAEEWHDQIAL